MNNTELKKQAHSYIQRIKANVHYKKEKKEVVDILFNAIEKDLEKVSVSRWRLFSLYNTEPKLFQMFRETNIYDDMLFLIESAKMSL